MSRRLAAFAVVVDDYDRAIAHYTQDLGFVLLEDDDRGNGKRWVRVAPSASSQCTVLLAKAANERQSAAIGNQTGGRVAFFLHTEDFQRDYAHLQSRGVCFVEAPRHEEYGTVAVFEDAYGNRWDLIEPRP
jgi:predicted enzyme related to lactoylglutathione lyase